MTCWSHSNNHSNDQTTLLLKRRQFLSPIIAATTTAVPLSLLLGSPAATATSDATTSQNNRGLNPILMDQPPQLDTGLLESRVTGNVMSPPVYGMECPDIFYPEYFNGVWTVSSQTTSVEAPCGLALFGGNTTFTNAQKEVGTSLLYRARFVPSSSSSTNTMIADRDYNVREIAKAAMGSLSVIDISVPSPNKVSCLLAPNGANKLFNVDLISVARRGEIVSPRDFHCAEVVRQILSSPDATSGRVVTAPVLKEVETASLYVWDGEEIRCRQRSATFLLPSQTDQRQFEMWRAARGRPIDVRFYDVVYRKV